MLAEDNKMGAFRIEIAIYKHKYEGNIKPLY